MKVYHCHVHQKFIQKPAVCDSAAVWLCAWVKTSQSIFMFSGHERVSKLPQIQTYYSSKHPAQKQLLRRGGASVPASQSDTAELVLHFTVQQFQNIINALIWSDKWGEYKITFSFHLVTLSILFSDHWSTDCRDVRDTWWTFEGFPTEQHTRLCWNPSTVCVCVCVCMCVCVCVCVCVCSLVEKSWISRKQQLESWSCRAD